MAKANLFGPSSVTQGGNALINDVLVDFDDDPSPVFSDIMPFENYDGCSVQLVSGGARSIEVIDGDHVVASTHVWTLKSGNFTTKDIGGTFTIAGSDEGNDDTYTIDDVTGPSTVHSAEAPAADETFDPDAVTVDLVQESPKGSWEFRVSNSYSPGLSTQVPNDGSPWTPINDQFSPAIADVSEQYVKDTANSANQYCQASPLDSAAIQFKFTPTSGRGPINAWFVAKGNR